MGYTTDFTGSLTLSRQLTTTEKNYINTFSGTRRMKRDVNKLMEIYKGKHGLPYIFKPTEEQQSLIEQLENSGLIVTVKPKKDNRTPEEIYGFKGEFFAREDGQSGQSNDVSVIEYNNPSPTQPGLWCQWVINNNNELEWDGGEKFYSYIEWLNYLIKNFFKPWGVLLNGEIEWVGEDSSDRGKIVVTDNKVDVFEVKIKYKKSYTIK